MYKQCRLKQVNLFTYRWVLNKKAIPGTILKVKDIKFNTEAPDIIQEWEVDTVWHLEQEKKFLYHTVD